MKQNEDEQKPAGTGTMVSFTLASCANHCCNVVYWASAFQEVLL